MNDKKGNILDPLNYLIDSFWASMPEKTADQVASFKKDVLKGVRDALNWVIDEEVKWTDRHVENARRMREQYSRKERRDEAGPGEPEASTGQS